MFRHTRGGAATRRGRFEMSGFTVVPRWTLKPVPGVGEHEVRVPDELMAASRQLADDLAVPLSSVLLAAHAKVLAALSSEREVCTGYAAAAGPPLPCRLSIEPDSWRALVLEAHAAEGKLNPTGPPFETVFNPSGDADREFRDDTVLWVGVREHGGTALRLRYKTDVLDADSAARIAGYHLTALSLITADPDIGHAGQSLLSAEELRLQIHGLAGPRKELPDRRAHQVFEERAR